MHLSLALVGGERASGEAGEGSVASVALALLLKRPGSEILSTSQDQLAFLRSQIEANLFMFLDMQLIVSIYMLLFIIF